MGNARSWSSLSKTVARPARSWGQKKSRSQWNTAVFVIRICRCGRMNGNVGLSCSSWTRSRLDVSQRLEHKLKKCPIGQRVGLAGTVAVVCIAVNACPVSTIYAMQLNPPLPVISVVSQTQCDLTGLGPPLARRSEHCGCRTLVVRGYHCL